MDGLGAVGGRDGFEVGGVIWGHGHRSCGWRPGTTSVPSSPTLNSPLISLSQLESEHLNEKDPPLSSPLSSPLSNQIQFAHTEGNHENPPSVQKALTPLCMLARAPVSPFGMQWANGGVCVWGRLPFRAFMH